jgi:integrase/recombinase XerC
MLISTLPVAACWEVDEWSIALERFLTSRRCQNTRTVYERAIHELIHFTGKQPAEVRRHDVIAWLDALNKKGLASTTVAQKLAGVSGFYNFVSTEYMVSGPDGRETPLHPSNPAAGKYLRPKVCPYGKAAWLGPEQAKGLLAAIDQSSVLGKRNYALLLGYLMTGRRNSEWRQARWQDFEVLGGTVYFRWSGKGKKDQRLELPPPVWAAVKNYLQSAGRLKSIRPDDFIFTALSNSARRLPGVAEDWCHGRAALSIQEVNRILKRYCKLAGLDAERLHIHSLRHTAAMLRREAGDGVEEIKEFLGHSSLAITEIYLHSLLGKQDKSWNQVADLLGLAEDPHTIIHLISREGKGGSSGSRRPGQNAPRTGYSPGIY